MLISAIKILLLMAWHDTEETILLNSSNPSALAYQTVGTGPLVILLHGLLMRGSDWLDSELVSALSKDYCVVCPDLPAHGDSPVFDNAEAYTLESQSQAIIQLIDQLGYQRAHIIGYSAGGWLATGLLQYYQERLSSVVIGGWDLVNGLPEGPDGPLDFATFMAYARTTAPELTATVTEEREHGLSHFFHELSQKQSVAQLVKQADTPLLFWAGQEDPYFAPIQQWCITNNFHLLSGTGDHLTTFSHIDASTAEALYRFIAQTHY